MSRVPTSSVSVRRPFFSAVALLVGTIVGAGIFALPLAFVRAGFWPGLLLSVSVGILVYVLHVAYAEVVLRTKRVRQFAGLAETYLGNSGRVGAFLVALAGGYGAMLAYIIGISVFVSLLISFVAVPITWYATCFVVLAFLAVFGGVAMVVNVQRVILGLLFLVLLILLFVGIPHIDVANLFRSGGRLPDAFSLYGVLLFAFMGTGAIVDMEQVLSKQKRRLLPAIQTGYAIAAGIYLLFVLVVVGVSGMQTSPQAIAGLVPVLGSWILVLGALFGIASMSTSFLSQALQLREAFELDVRLPRFLSVLLAIGVPYLLYLLGFADFGRVIEFVGAIAVGATIVLILAMHTRAQKQSGDRPPFTIIIPRLVRFVLYVLLLAGIIYGIAPSLFARFLA